MPPPKLKLYKTGKPKTLSKPPTIAAQSPGTDSSISNTTASDLDSDNVRQFELELAWCIQTMEGSLNGGKLNAGQGNFVLLLNDGRGTFDDHPPYHQFKMLLKR